MVHSFQEKLVTMNRLFVLVGRFSPHLSLETLIKTPKKLPEKATSEVNFIYPKLRDQLMVKEDDKI